MFEGVSVVQVQQLDSTYTPILAAFNTAIVRSGLAGLFLNVTGAANTADFNRLFADLRSFTNNASPLAQTILVRYPALPPLNHSEKHC